jgi:hypothetical protein
MSLAAQEGLPDYRRVMTSSSFHGDFGRQIGAMGDLEDALAEVAETHAGRPQPEVLNALDRTIRSFGLQPNYPDVADQAQQISEGHAQNL